jgi:hypothetical protein
MALVQAMGVAQLLAGHPPYPGTGQPQQPAGVLGQHEMPRRPQHVRAHDGAVIQQSRQLGLVRVLGTRGHRPPRLTGILGLDGQQRTNSLARRTSTGPHQVLTAQPPPGNLKIPHAAATLPGQGQNKTARRAGIPATQRTP